MSIKLFTILFSILLLSMQMSGEEVKTLEIGTTAPNFNLKGVDGKMYTLQSFAKANILVILFSCNHCPTAQAYEDRMIKFVNDYKSKNVSLVIISPNSDKAVQFSELGYTDLSDSYPEMILRAKDKKYNFPYLYDGATQAISKKYGAVATPHAFVFDKSRKLKYQGRIDDNEHIGREKVHDLRNAVDALLAGQEVTTTTTKVFGCSVKWEEKSKNVNAEVESWAKMPVSLEKVNLDQIKALAKNEGSGKYRLINVWATWCGPCVREFTGLVESHHMYRRRDFEFISVSMDAPKNYDKTLAFLKEKYASNKNVIYDGEDKYALIEAIDPNWQGALPYTLLISPEGKVVYNQMGLLDIGKLRKNVADHLGRYYD